MSRLLAAMAAIVAVSHAAAQGRYPEKPIHLLVGFPAGSTADVAARLVGQKWSEALAKPVVVENLAGAETPKWAKLISESSIRAD